MAFVAAFLAFASLSPMCETIFAEEAIELPNLNFEEVATGQEIPDWKVVNPERYPGEIQVLPNIGHDHKAALQITLGPGLSIEDRYCTWVRNGGKFSAENGGKIAFRLFAKADNPCKVYVCLFQETEDGRWAGSVLKALPDVSTDWQEFTGELAVKGVNAETKEELPVARASLGLIVYGENNQTGAVVYIDDIRIRPE